MSFLPNSDNSSNSDVQKQIAALNLKVRRLTTKVAILEKSSMPQPHRRETKSDNNEIEEDELDYNCTLQ